MSVPKRGRYSKYIRPVSVLFDMLALTLLFPVFYTELGINMWYFGIYQIVGWLIVSYFLGFYEVYRYTTPVQILAKITRQGIIFLLVVNSYFPFSKQGYFSGKATAKYLIAAFIAIVIFKILLYFYLKRYRVFSGGNYRNAIIIGYTAEAVRLKQLFESRPDYGYNFRGYFSDKNSSPKIVGTYGEIQQFVIENDIDELYCSLSEINSTQVKELISFSADYNKEIKFIPDRKEIFSKNLKMDYYDFFPVLSLRKTPLDEPFATLAKRLFDIVFSILVIIFLLSWLIPLLAVLIKLESKGPVFFKQSRPGLDEKEFFCYKFRSMQVNKTTEMSVTKNDPRVTKIGKFIRKTSMDEMPQFLNVLKGEMSVVGPRPNLWTQKNLYSTKIKKYIVRHYVKPGITGLAQVKGYRGEIETDEDMINRIKYDVFYIENWSIFLDLKIIVQTVINIFKGEEKAY